MMLSMLRCVAFALVSLAFVACGPKSAPRSPGGAVPALFASIPADTPYVLASAEAIPLEAFTTIKRASEVVQEKIAETLRERDGRTEDDRVVEALLAEMAGKWNVAGFESLGLTTTPRFALYGIGLQPTVFRIEVKDAPTVLATIERIAKRADVKLPPMETHEGRKFWRLPSGNNLAVVALVDNQFVVGFGPRVGVERSLSLILGSKKPTRNMADGKALAAVRAKHGFDPYAIAVVDTRNTANAFLAQAGITATPACSSELDRIAARVPRIAASYNLSRTRHAMVIVVELASDLIGQLTAMKVEVPGLAAALAAKRMATFGGGVDVAVAQKTGVAIADAVRRIGEACNSSRVHEAGAKLQSRLSEPLPRPLALLGGGFLSILSMSHELPLPSSFEGYGVLSASSIKPVFELINSLDMVAGLGIEPDGALHSVGDKLPLRLPYGIFAGVGKRVMVVAAGERGKEQAAAALEAPAEHKAPFFVGHYDYGRWFELKAKRDAATDPLEAKVSATFARIFGRVDYLIDVHETGLKLEFAYEVK